MKVLIICLLLFGIYEANAETPKNETLPTVKKSEPVDKKPETKNKKVDSGVSSFVEMCLKSTNLMGRNKAILCTGATSRKPVDCYYSTNLKGMEAALACTERSLGWINAVIEMD